jgi:hypothetical protein
MPPALRAYWAKKRAAKRKHHPKRKRRAAARTRPVAHPVMPPIYIVEV